MEAIRDSYFTAYRSLKLTRDADGVLVVAFHSKGGRFRFTAQEKQELVIPWLLNMFRHVRLEGFFLKREFFPLPRRR